MSEIIWNTLWVSVKVRMRAQKAVVVPRQLEGEAEEQSGCV